MIHPAGASRASSPSGSRPGRITGNPFFSQQFYETDRGRGFVRGYSLVVYGPSARPAGLGRLRAGPLGRRPSREMRRRFGHSVGIAVMAEDLPEDVNRVELDPEVKDAQRHPRAARDLPPAENTRKMLAHGAAAARQVLEAAGAIEVRDTRTRRQLRALMGTARMGSDPTTSVVNAWNQAHEVPNLFVVDGSSFTTSAAVNPTSTIGALALRAADGIWERRREF